MRLLTARSSHGPCLYVEVPAGFARLDDVAAAANEPELQGVSDLGALLRMGETAWDTVAEAAERLGDAAIAVQPLESLQLAPPVLAPSKIICVGHNYHEHIREGGAEIPEEPLLFAKTANTLIGHGEPVRYPPITSRLDYEGELTIVIRRRTCGVSESAAMDCVAGFTIMNDISARDLQHGVSQWFLGKSLDTFAPTGPFLVTPDVAGPYASLRLQTRVNGELRQDASCQDMIFSPSRLIAYITRGITLEAGDMIATGTPSGVGLGFHPPRYLSVGDVVEVSITGLGTLRSPIAGGTVA